jgi:hypothetical protein
MCAAEDAHPRAHVKKKVIVFERKTARRLLKACAPQ